MISGAGLFKGYWGDSVEVQVKLRDYGFRTGDMGMAGGDGKIRLMGRMDDMIKIMIMHLT